MVLPVTPYLTLAEKLGDLKKRMWKNLVDKHYKQPVLIQDNLTPIYRVAWGQCSKGMQAKLGAHTEFEKEDLKENCQWLPKEIKGITFKFEEHRFGFLSLNDTHCDLCNCWEHHDETLQSFSKTLKSKVEVLEHYEGAFGSDPGLLAAAGKLNGVPSKEQAQLKFTKVHALAILFNTHAAHARYGVICSKNNWG